MEFHREHCKCFFFFFVLGSNWSDNKFGDEFFSGQKHCRSCKQHVLVRFLFIPVPVSMGCQGTTELLPSSHPIPWQVQGKGSEASPKPICGCRAPLAGTGHPWKSLHQIWESSPSHGLFGGQAASQSKTKYLPGRTLQAKIYGKKTGASGLALRPD